MICCICGKEKAFIPYMCSLFICQKCAERDVNERFLSESKEIA